MARHNPANSPNAPHIKAETDPLSALTYEQALQQLEEILDTMNGSVPLAESVTLYERADRLLKYCSKKLEDAESKIETLMRNRGGDIALGSDGRPQIESLPPQASTATQKMTESAPGDLPF